jgi:phosphoribosylamine---glycine ligase
MNVLVVGSGGREHCLVWKISQSSLVNKIYCAPGNGGTDRLAENINIKAEEIDKLLEFAKRKNIDLTVIGPEVPLVAGIVDVFKSKGLKVFGPSKELAQLEGSKIYAKSVMNRFAVPTADYEVFEDAQIAKAYVDKKGAPVVVKADGLAAGKGVFVCSSTNEAKEAIDIILVKKEFGDSGKKIIIEECLEGQEVSVLVLTDGETIVPLVSSQDHKRIFDGDFGPNTGGMGAYAPAPILYGDKLARAIDIVFKPIIEGLKSEGTPYKGMLYGGLMIKDDKINVLEFNVRFGDPETQAILPKLKGDLADIMLKVTEGNLDKAQLCWDERFCVCVVLASGGYPGKYEKGKTIEGLDFFADKEDVFVFHAGTELVHSPQTIDHSVVTNGGRVLGVSALADTVAQAQSKVYSAIDNVDFENMFYRKDIANKALTENERV